MKIAYCINSLKNSGGMERITIDKANYLVDRYNYDITIITTDQDKKEIFYEINNKIKLIDLNINYFRDDTKSFGRRIIPYIFKRNLHKKRLKELLLESKFDIVISTGCHESIFLPNINDGSKKIREFHFAKNYRKSFVKSFRKSFLYRIKANIDTYLEEKSCKKYSKIVVLTKKDYLQWNNNKKLCIIPNFIKEKSKKITDCMTKKAISVGRLDGQKGFDRLIDAWKEVNKEFSDWKLEIYGEGIDRPKLEEQIFFNNLDKNIFLKGAVKNIKEHYTNASIFVMSSRYEGFGIVLIEAMNCGLPLVAFDCLCGPSDIIENGENGFLIEDGNTKELANKLIKLMKDENIRKKFSINNIKNREEYLPEKIMNKWDLVFKEILGV